MSWRYWCCKLQIEDKIPWVSLSHPWILTYSQETNHVTQFFLSATCRSSHWKIYQPLFWNSWFSITMRILTIQQTLESSIRLSLNLKDSREITNRNWKHTIVSLAFLKIPWRKHFTFKHCTAKEINSPLWYWHPSAMLGRLLNFIHHYFCQPINSVWPVKSVTLD